MSKRLMTALGVALLAGTCVHVRADTFGALDPNAICIRPTVPHCMLDEATFKSADGQRTCDDQTALFVKELAGYRGCMIATSQRVVSNANDLLSDYRCRRGQTDRCGRQPTTLPSNGPRSGR